MEKPPKKFPIIGKIAQKVSNGWKNRPKSFQWLEKWLKFFPMIGKKFCVILRRVATGQAGS
ncbi:MAG: hypothetical protein EOM20_16630 [Spartobacteria bacterium]|nr:hypothetical protein [Spartobacteria bacterium]